MVFGLFKKLQKKAEKPAQTVTAVQPAQDSLMPDTPIPFGYKTGWLCIRCDDPDRAMDVLHGTNRRVCNWSVGLAKAGENGTVFVSPVLDGYVLVVGILEPQPEQLECWAAEFPELQYFGTHRRRKADAGRTGVGGRTVPKGGGRDRMGFGGISR